MNDYTRAVFPGLQQGQSDFANIYSQLTNRVQDLEGQLRTNLSRWDGSAQQAYHAAQAQWNAAMADMATVLNQLSAVIGVAHENYTTTEAANSQLWS